MFDVNWWLAFEAATHVHHKRAEDWFQNSERLSCVHCRVTQMSLLRLMTNKVVMRVDVLSAEEAWEVVKRTRARADVEWMDEPASLESTWETLSLLGSPKGSWWTDAYLAAFAIGHNLRLVTFDAGYRRFESEGLDLLVLQPAP
ncbi:MAG TPA: TA system VapC family ribonuclease toxin [Chthoniobacteraceae bacterium]|nr:TA system VapC family ribonuclease toxin [Chthoniobacteraceae bacterium]